MVLSLRSTDVTAAETLATSCAIIVAVPAAAQASTDPAVAANAFLATLASKGPDAAWSSASPAFRAATSKIKWRNYTSISVLDRFQSSSWTERKFHDRNALVAGTVTVAGGATIPARIQLERTARGWLVSRVDLKLRGAAYQAAQQLAE